MWLNTLITLTLIVALSAQPFPVWTDNCISVTSAGTCAQCVEGFYLEYFLCLPCAPLCRCSSQYNYCESCMSISYKGTNYSTLAVYQPAASKCIFCYTLIPNCLECADSSHCTKCFGGYFIVEYSNSTICSNTTCNSNCEICADALTCEQCTAGFYLDRLTKQCSNNSCQNNCRVCADPATCQTCELTYYYDNKMGQCVACTASCLECKDAITCDVCAPGYYSNGTQGCVNSGFPNCTLYYPNAETATDCQVCAPGYFVLFGDCNQCVGCDLCSLQFLCQTGCQAGATAFNYACLVPFVIFEEWMRWGVLLLILLALI